MTYIPPLNQDTSEPKMLGPDPSSKSKYRCEIAPIDQQAIPRILNQFHRDGWEFVSQTVVPVALQPPTPQNPQPPQVPGLLMIFRRIRPVADAGAERQAMPVLETLHDAIRQSLPFMGLTGILREKLDGVVAAAGKFLEQPA